MAIIRSIRYLYLSQQMGECGIGKAGIYIKFCSKLTGASNISFELLESGLGKLEYVPELANIPQTVKVCV